MKQLMVAATMVGALACATMSAHADDPVYITGAEYTLDGDTLTVTSGDGTLAVQTPSSMLHLKIMEGASLKLGIDSPFGANHVLHVFGTLDLNGKSFSALRIATNMGTFPVVLKEALKMIGHDCGDCVRPIQPLSDAQRAKLRDVLAGMKLL